MRTQRNRGSLKVRHFPASSTVSFCHPAYNHKEWPLTQEEVLRMPVIELENLELANGHRRLSVPRARLDVSWPEGCMRLDVRQREIHAWAMLSVDVPKDGSPIRQGGLWQLRVSRQGRCFALDLLATSLDGIEAAKSRFRRIHRWTMAIVGFTADPLDWFPKPRFLQEAPDENILVELAAFLREDPSLAAVETVQFTSEGGWHKGSGA